MALTRKFLAALGIEADKIDEIITAHVDTMDAIKSERDQYKADAEKLPELQSTIDSLNKKISENDNNKYDELLAEYNKYKSDVEARETQRNAEVAYRQLLIESGVSEKRLDAILKVTDLSKITFDAEGKVKDAETLKANIQSEWSDFIVKQGEVGASTPEPPTQNNPSMFSEMSLADKMAYANDHPTAVEVVSWLKGES